MIACGRIWPCDSTGSTVRDPTVFFGGGQRYAHYPNMLSLTRRREIFVFHAARRKKTTVPVRTNPTTQHHQFHRMNQLHASALLGTVLL